MALRVLCLLLICLAATPSPASEARPARLMLASDYRAGEGRPIAEYWVSEKLDGVRGRWDGTRLRTRGGHAIDSPAWFTAGWPRLALDGELWAGRGRFDHVSGIVRALEPDHDAWRTLRFMVFDLPDDPEPFGGRVAHMREVLAEAGVPWLQPIAQFRVADSIELDRRLEAVIAGGGEGLMLHHDQARYRSGRSKGLLKLKPHQDAEARVVGYTRGRGRYRGMVGALIVERPDGLRIRLGSGLDDAERADPPPIGSLVTYRYTGLTRSGIPRFARYLRVRDEPALVLE